MDVEAKSGRYQDVEAQALAVAVFKDEKADTGFLKELDAATGGMVKSVIESEELKGKEGETVYLHLPAGAKLKARGLLLIGAGDQKEHTTAQVSIAAGTAVRFLRSKSVKTIAFVPRADGDAEVIAAAALKAHSLRCLIWTNIARLIRKRGLSTGSWLFQMQMRMLFSGA